MLYARCDSCLCRRRSRSRSPRRHHPSDSSPIRRSPAASRPSVLVAINLETLSLLLFSSLHCSFSLLLPCFPMVAAALEEAPSRVAPQGKAALLGTSELRLLLLSPSPPLSQAVTQYFSPPTNSPSQPSLLRCLPDVSVSGQGSQYASNRDDSRNYVSKSH